MLESGINRSLLVIGNLSNMGTSRTALGTNHASMTTYFLHSYLQAMLNKRHIHSRGLVKLLAWVHQDDLVQLMPRTISSNSKFPTFLNQPTNTSFIVGRDRSNEMIWKYRRHFPIDLASQSRTASTTKAEEIYDPPKRRQPPLFPHPITIPYTSEDRSALMEAPYKSHFFQELLDLEAFFENDRDQWVDTTSMWRRNTKVPKEQTRLSSLRSQYSTRRRQYVTIENLLKERLALDDEERHLASTNGDAEAWSALEKRIRLWLSHKSLQHPTIKKKVLKDMDDWRAFRSEPPVLAWNCRQADPLYPKNDEFYPTGPLSLVELEPNPRFFELIDTHEKITCLYYVNQIWSRSTIQNVGQYLEELAPGSGSLLATRVPSLMDPLKGSSRFLFDVRVRTLPPMTLVELAVALEKFPFRPSFTQMLRSCLVDTPSHFDPET